MSAICDHCGLPLAAAVKRGEKLYCCYGCLLAARIIGPGHADGTRSWAILRLAVGAFLSMEVMMLSLLLYTGQVEAEAAAMFRWILLASSAPAMLLLVPPFVRGAVAEARALRLSLDTLIAVGCLAAFGVSAANTIRGRGNIYFDTATMLPVLVTFGKLLEATAKSRAAELMESLQTLVPRRALRVSAGVAEEVDAAALAVGDMVRVRPGERIAVDGVIREGGTTIEEAAFTGESRPRLCGVGDSVIAGTVNGPGGIVVEARQVGQDMLLCRILEMVRQARLRPSATERLAERLARAFTPAVLLLAAGAAVAWYAWAGPAKAAMVGLAVLVVACPCAMGIAAPLATALALARAAREGVLVRGGDVMEKLGLLHTLFLDKTGTLTAGRPRVLAVETFDGVGPDELLASLATLESASEHVLAGAVVDEARSRGLAIGQVTDFTVFPGRGVQGSVSLAGQTRQVLAGPAFRVARSEYSQPCAQCSRHFGLGDAQDVAANIAATAPGAETREPDGSITLIDVSWDGRPVGRVKLIDELRPDAAPAVRELSRQGISAVCLSGDRTEAVEEVARRVGMARASAGVAPQDKIAELEAARAGGRVVGMVGDGVNDAPALAAADVGIALGAGTDLARQAGNVVLLGDDLSAIPWLVALSRRTRRTIKQNLAWAFGYNALALAAAAAGVLHPLLAAVAMVASSLTVLSNSVRLAGMKCGVDCRRTP